MRRRDDHWHSAGDVVQHAVHHPLALRIGQHELLGKVGQDAEAVRPGVDHEIDSPALALQIQLPSPVEHRGDDREHTLVSHQ